MGVRIKLVYEEFEGDNIAFAPVTKRVKTEFCMDELPTWTELLTDEVIPWLNGIGYIIDPCQINPYLEEFEHKI